MAPRNIDELLFHMPMVQDHAPDEWVKGFAASVLKQSRRRNWRPSPKQVAVMRRLVSELFHHDSEEGDPVLIED